ncbi:unnamed protein product [Effrenium voratum]|nr:unnamed protein product [Effrenium voratum]
MVVRKLIQLSGFWRLQCFAKSTAAFPAFPYAHARAELPGWLVHWHGWLVCLAISVDFCASTVFLANPRRRVHPNITASNLTRDAAAKALQFARRRCSVCWTTMVT